MRILKHLGATCVKIEDPMRRYGLLLIMSLLLVVVIQAQTEADWEVPLYTTEGIQVVTAEGIEYIIPLPEAQPKYIFGTS